MIEIVGKAVEKPGEEHSGWHLAALIVLSVAMFAGIILLPVVLD